jgi:hypothetical protein
MCWVCDNPHASHADYLMYLRSIMNECGWAVQGVESDGVHPPWAYTVGLSEWGEPELVVTGMPLTKAAGLLNEVAEHAVHAAAPAHGEQMLWGTGPLIEIVEVAVPEAHLNAAVDFYGPRVRARQIVHADDRGHWPWDRWYRGVRGGQPVLGPRAPESARRRLTA